MKKQLNVDLIQSELRGGSAFFPGYKGEASAAQMAEERERTGRAASAGPQDAAPERVPVREPVPPPVPLVPKVRRPIRQRQPFDIYEDQYERLKEIRDAEREFVNGRGMSQMVREAIDMYLQKRGSSQK